MVVGTDFVPVLDEHLVVIGLEIGIGERVAIIAEGHAARQDRGAVERLNGDLIKTGRQTRDRLGGRRLPAGGILNPIAAVADGRSLNVVDRPATGVLEHRGVGDFAGLVQRVHGGNGGLQFTLVRSSHASTRSNGGEAGIGGAGHDAFLGGGINELPHRCICKTVNQDEAIVLVDSHIIALGGVCNLTGLVDTSQDHSP